MAESFLISIFPIFYGVYFTYVIYTHLVYVYSIRSKSLVYLFATRCDY